ncbi:hypothetical protein D3C85_1636970 [compost metagenome]
MLRLVVKIIPTNQFQQVFIVIIKIKRLRVPQLKVREFGLLSYRQQVGFLL